MTQANDNFFPTDPEQLLRSPQAQALLAQLQQMDQSLLAQAAQLAADGNADGAQQLLRPILQDETIQRLTREMRDGHGGI